MIKKLGLIIAIFLVFLMASGDVSARIGVGVGTGKIEVEEKLKPGVIYELPELTVINTGDEASDYQVTVEYRENQEEQKPPEEWFNFSPKEFYLEPGQSQVVDLELSIPVDGAAPLEYFAFLSASPTKKAQDGSTTIGVAAAAKLYFEVAPGNIFEGVFYRGLSVYKKFLPWSNVVLGTVLFVIVVGLIRKFVNIDIGIKRKNTKAENEE